MTTLLQMLLPGGILALLLIAGAAVAAFRRLRVRQTRRQLLARVQELELDIAGLRATQGVHLATIASLRARTGLHEPPAQLVRDRFADIVGRETWPTNPTTED